jgi:anti-sigma factor RsiW
MAAVHLTDRQLLLDVEGELSTREQKRVRRHLEACWHCRTRRQELERAIADFVHVQQREFDTELPASAGPRALLKASLSQLSATLPARRSIWFFVSRGWAPAAAMCGLMALGLAIGHWGAGHRNTSSTSAGVFSIPDSRLTPGATVLLSRPAVCAQPDTKNKAVPVALQRKVFEEYGIAGADPRAYEVDYLVTPALGGADDIHNLWPHSYSATAWNAQVKDALEDRLREMVCGGSLELAEAQREIAGDWIAAYKKYFHTDNPLAEHCRECVR